MFLLSSCASLCLLAGTDLPLAQVSTSEASDLGEIVVLGNRKQRDLTLGAGAETERMSPSSRSIESDLLNAIGAVRMADALELVSGVSQQNNRGGVMDNFAIRGFLGTPDGGAEYYVDGFLANRGMAPPRDPSTAERIEVLKGPAGALFGDIDPAGRVNIVSKTPRFTPDAQFTATLGSFGLRRGELDLTGPVSENTAGRIVLTGETSSGWRDHVGLDRTVIAPSLTWQPLHGLRLTYVGEFTTFSTLFDRGQPAINGDALALPASHYFGEPSDGLTHFRNERHQVTGEYQLNDSWILSGGFAWRGGTLKGLSSDHSRLVGDTLWRQRRGRDFSVEDISARLELRGERRTAVGVHHVAFGTKAYKLAYGERWLRINPTEQHPYPINVFEPVYGGSAPTPLPFTDNLEEREVVTFYMQDMWEVTERLSLSAGLRYDHYEQMILNNRTGQTGSNDDTPVDYRLAGRYRLNDNFTLHASYGQSFVLNSGTGRNGSGFAPEEGKGYELGLAGAWDNLDVNITYFDIEKTNILTNDPVDANYLAPVGRLTTRGIELDGAFRLDNRWQVVANYAWTEARADDASFASDDVLNVPEHSGSAFIIGRFSTAHNTQWSFTAGAAYSGDRAAAIDGSGVRLPAYWKSKAAIEYGLTSRIAARAEVDNLFDERYAQSSYSSLWIFPGKPRSFTASLKLSL